MQTTDTIIALALKYVGTYPSHEASARVCLADAVSLRDAGDLYHARKRAINSLRYSVGILSPHYQRAVAGHVSLCDREGVPL